MTGKPVRIFATPIFGISINVSGVGTLLFPVLPSLSGSVILPFCETSVTARPFTSCAVTAAELLYTPSIEPGTTVTLIEINFASPGASVPKGAASRLVLVFPL